MPPSAEGDLCPPQCFFLLSRSAVKPVLLFLFVAYFWTVMVGLFCPMAGLFKPSSVALLPLH